MTRSDFQVSSKYIRGAEGRINHSRAFSHVSGQVTDNPYGLFIVSQGIAGFGASPDIICEIANKAISHKLRDLWLTKNPISLSEERLRARIQAAVLSANERILAAKAENPDQFRDFSGASVTLALIYRELVIAANVGNNRLYQFRDNQLHQITEDHSFVNRLVKIGKISQAEARTHPQRNIIMRFVGYNTELEVDLYSFVLQPGDWLMLCNSYFWQSVPDNEIEEVIKGYSHPDDVTKQLQKFEKLEWQDYVYIIVKMD